MVIQIEIWGDSLCRFWMVVVELSNDRFTKMGRYIQKTNGERPTVFLLSEHFRENSRLIGD